MNANQQKLMGKCAINLHMRCLSRFSYFLPLLQKLRPSLSLSLSLQTSSMASMKRELQNPNSDEPEVKKSKATQRVVLNPADCDLGTHSWVHEFFNFVSCIFNQFNFVAINNFQSQFLVSLTLLVHLHTHTEHVYLFILV